MPQLSFAVTKGELAVPVLIAQSRPMILAGLAAGHQPMPPLQARGVLDTGSNATAVSPALLQQLGLQAGKSATSQTTGGQFQVRLFRISLSIVDHQLPSSDWLTYSDMVVSELATTLPDADILIGLDILLDCKLLLDGPARQFALEF